MRVYLDTNVCYLLQRPQEVAPALRGWFAEWRDRLLRGQDDAVVSPLVFDELAYRLLLAHMKDAGESNVLGLLRADKEGALRRHGPKTASILRDIAISQRLSIAPVTEQTFKSALRFMVTYALLPRDACHLAAAAESGCEGILSTDPDFARSQDLVTWLGPPASG